METLTNKQIDVTAYYFGGQKGAKKCFPKRLEFEGQVLAILESGLRCLVQTAEKTVEVFTMSDGMRQYSIRHEPTEGSWTLVNSHSL